MILTVFDRSKLGFVMVLVILSELTVKFNQGQSSIALFQIIEYIIKVKSELLAPACRVRS